MFFLEFDSVADSNAVVNRKTSREFEDVEGLFARIKDLRKGLGYDRMFNAYDLPRSVDPNDINREIHTLHPDTMPIGEREHEKHPAPFRNSLSAGQSSYHFFFRIGDLCRDGNIFDANSLRLVRNAR